MSNFPMFVAPLSNFKSDDNFSVGDKQYRNWHIVWGCKIVVFPKMLLPEDVAFSEFTKT